MRVKGYEEEYVGRVGRVKDYEEEYVGREDEQMNLWIQFKTMKLE